VLYEHLSPEKQMNTITHEIAHALVGHVHGHDHVWRRKHLELGGDGRTCSDMEFDETTKKKVFKYLGKCPNGHTVTRAARSEKMYILSCSRCSPVYNPLYMFTWTQNF
jgi:predicted SprT family Zn-dependent metalloprotease